MKNDKDFLQGIYNRAKVLEEEKSRKKMIYTKVRQFSVMAAVIVILPLLYSTKVWQPYEYLENPQIMRISNVEDLDSNLMTSDFIIVGKTKKIDKSQYIEEENSIYTHIIIEPEEILLGDINENEIVLSIKGGKVRQRKIYSKMEGEFKKESRSLLFLHKGEENKYYLVHGEASQFKEIDKDIFVDKLGNKHSLEDIKNKIDRRY